MSRLAKSQNAVRTKQSVSKDPGSSIDMEPEINLEREFDAVRKSRHLEQQCRELRGRHKEDEQQEGVQKEDVQKENTWQEQECHNQYKQECKTFQVLKTSLIPEQKCQTEYEKKCQTRYDSSVIPTITKVYHQR